jgi:hypothetical protein
VARFEISVSDSDVDTPDAAEYQTVDFNAGHSYRTQPPSAPEAYQTVDAPPAARVYQTVDAPPAAKAYQTTDQGPAAYQTSDADAAQRAGTEDDTREISPLSG